MLPALVLLALLALAPAGPAAARRHAPDLREDEPARRTTRPAECQFGKQAKELGSTWFADLGPPFGVMYCIKCECIPVQKKRRVVAKVQCRNIKSECPEPSCDTPTLLPGRCCKTCPGDINSPDIVQDDSPTAIITNNEDEELSMRHFGALLTGRSPLCIRRDDMTGVPVAAGVATARLTFRRRHLFWSVLLGTSVSVQPRALAFLDRGGRMLLEHPLKRAAGIHATYEEKTDKLCGVWRRVPREYKRILREGSLYVALIWGDERNNSMESALSGRINRYPALATEMFTSLLEPEHVPKTINNGPCDEYRVPGKEEEGWWGGTAVVTGAAGAAPSLHLAIVYNGVFTSASTDQSVRVLLTLPERNQTIIDEVQKISKPGYELNILEVSTPVSAAELRSLSRGRLLVSVEALETVERRISGTVRQRAACEVFHAPLIAERPSAALIPQGLAMVYIDKDGSLVYDIQVENLSITDPKITLVEEQGKRHSQVEILDTRMGVLARPSARIFPPLYEDQLAVHIGSDTGPPILRGRLLSRPLPDAASEGPSLLRRTDARLPPTINPVAGLAWIAVDALCGLNYEVVINGYSGVWSAWLEGNPNGQRILPGLEGSILEPSPSELLALNSGSAYLNVRTSDNDTEFLRTRLPQISVPSSCLPVGSYSIGRSDNELSFNYAPTHMNSPPPDNSLSNTASCYYAGKSYEDGSQWMATESCHMCGCVHGALRCDAVRCPPITCAVPTMRPPGQCCPICTNSTKAVWNESHGCHLAGQYHAPGSSWHPYLVPGGYDTCAICTCEFATRQVRCPRVRCPPLKCAEKDAHRPDKKSCCRVCPEVKAKKTEEDTPKDQGTPRTAEEILAEGGCKFPDGPLPNGKEVHPSIHSHGEQRCVTCRCKDGEVTCIRKRCSRAACARRRRGDACCACARHRRQRAPPPPPPS